MDADYIIDALNDRRRAADTLDALSSEGIAVSWVTVGEIYEGAFRRADPRAHIQSLREFVQPFRKLGVDDETMVRFAEIRASLRQNGHIISDFDIVAGATALRHDLTVLTRNLRHFNRIRDVKLYPVK